MARLFPLLLACLLAAGPAGAGEELAGPAIALDGDTIQIAGERIRLWGIDAPEMRDWPWGAHSRATLDRLIAGHEIACRQVTRDRYKRIIAYCHRVADDTELGIALLLAGSAVVYRRFTLEPPEGLQELADIYADSERRAIAQGRGVWKPR